MKIRRVGTLTCGVILLILGVLCLVHIFCPALRYEYILRGWPVILILVGVEMLFANVVSAENVQIKYDIPAVIIVFLLIGFTMGMAGAEFVMDYYGY